MPTYRVRVPGRVNLIGEHIDYAGLPVLPMALQREIRVVLRPRNDSRIRVKNLDPRFSDQEFELAAGIPPGPPGGWGNYLRAGAQVAFSWGGVGRGMDAVVGADLPVAAGLSSSSALMIGVTLGLMEGGGRSHQGSLSRIELAEALAEGERYTGTLGGGMDQAICLLARTGHAARIDFHPLRMESVRVPEGWTFVLADSGETAEKSGNLQAAYNDRRMDVERALADVVSFLELPIETGYPTLLEKVGLGLGLGPEPGTVPGPADQPGGLDELLQSVQEELEPHRLARFRHVVTEARRVHRAVGAMREGDAGKFGALMSRSHESLAGDFEVSTPALDSLVDVAIGAGALGARLTGAGFGGCVVALTDPSRVDFVLEAMRREIPNGVGTQERVFSVSPGSGASVEPYPG